ncbi:MAG: DUF3179 domain-containing protein [Acidobacteria bacterium]|nr:DUF3179 domain-containing protein [Acidobacteriota bacterium]
MRRRAIGAISASLFVTATVLLAAPQGVDRPAGLGRFERLRTPRFVPAGEAASFMKEDDRVMEVSADGVAKAYLVPVVAFHHIVFDRLPSGPILVTW